MTNIELSVSLWLVKTYGERLKELRELKFPSQEAMAAAMGLKRQGNLPLYEKNKKTPDVETVLKHAKALAIKPSEFLKNVVVTEYDRIREGAYDALNVDHEVKRIEHVVARKKRATLKHSRGPAKAHIKG